jgi:hypothetical protein
MQRLRHCRGGENVWLFRAVYDMNHDMLCWMNPQNHPDAESTTWKQFYGVQGNQGLLRTTVTFFGECGGILNR